MRQSPPADLEAAAPGRMRLAYDELLANQLALAVIRQRLRRSAGRPLTSPGKLRQAILSRLPFKLTGAQARARREIDVDLAGPYRMLRLLQGDVGGQDGGASRHGDRCRGRSTGGVHGANRALSAPAPQDHEGSPRRLGFASPSSAAARKALSGKRSLRRLPSAASTFSSARTLCFRSRSHSAISRWW